jgi:hypothetical protein
MTKSQFAETVTAKPRGSARARAWRNLMVAAINAALEQGLFALDPADKRWPRRNADGECEPCLFSFTVGDVEGMALIKDDGWDEIGVHAALRPTPKAPEFLAFFNAGLLAGDAYAAGWLERRRGAYLQTSPSLFKCRQLLLPVVADAAIEPRGFADHGRLIV